MRVDFGLTSSDYAQHRAGFPETFFARLAACGIGIPAQVVVDFGTGTGTLARGFARRGCRVVGVDPAERMLDAARHLDAAVGVQVEYRLARAEDSGLGDATADVITAGQCWHWFERLQAAKEAARILRPAGTLVIAHFDWIPMEGNVVHATEKLIERHNPLWKMGGGTGLYPEWLQDVALAGFHEVETFSYDVLVAYTHAGWRGRVRASAGVGGSLPEDAIREFDSALQGLLADAFSADPLSVPHRVFAVIARTPAQPGIAADAPAARR